MSKRKRGHAHGVDADQPEPMAAEDEGVVHSLPDEAEDEAWDAPDFRNRILRDSAFVAAPAIVMVLLGEMRFAAFYFGVGILVIIYEARRQIRALWRALLSAQ